MLKRIITSIFALAILIPVLIFSHTWIFEVSIAIVSILCLFELFKCMKVHKNFALTTPVYIFSLFFAISPLWLGRDHFLAMIAFMCTAAYLIYMFALVIWSGGKLALGKACEVFIMALYIIVSLNMICYIRHFTENGKFIYLLIFIGAWITDIFAYFTGVFFGKHKLIESISPKKTVEGSIGGTVFCSLGFVVMGIVANYFGCNANFVFLAISGIFISVIAQIGDLIMSAIKRHYGIKDFGKIFPGHGGMLDRFDSIIAVSLGVSVICMVSYVTGIPIM